MVSLIASVAVASASHTAAAQVRQPRGSGGGAPLIVDNPARSSSPVVFRLGTRPILDVGGLQTNPDDEFSQNHSQLQGVLLQSGGIAVADRHRVVFFDKAGRRIRAVGRPGSGPNEFREISSMCVTRSDTIIVADGTLSRYTVIAGNGAIVRSFQRDEARRAPANACFDDGTFLVFTKARESPQVDRIAATVLSTDNRVIAELTEMRAAPAVDLVTQSVVSVVATGDRVVLGDGVKSEFRVFDRTGTLLRIVRSADSVTEVTAQQVEEQLHATIPRNVSAAERNARLERIRAVASRKTWPAYALLRPGPAGQVWMQAYRRRSKSPFESEDWAVFDSAGKLEGRLLLPPHVLRDRPPPRVIAFGDGSVLIKRIDDDGAPHLTLYALQRIR